MSRSSSIISIIIVVFYPEAGGWRCSLKKVFVKIFQNPQEDNTCTMASYLSAASTFINEEILAQCFAKADDYFCKKLHYRRISQSTKTFLCESQW